MNHLIYFETGSTDPAYNLAFEQYIFENHRSGDILILWQNDNTIVVGQNQNAEQEINRSFVDAHNIHVVRRMTGGGTVYHDLGNLNYSFISDVDDIATLSYTMFTEPVIRALKELGLNAESTGRNDVTVNGCKISGTAQRVANGRVLHHGTLLFDSDKDMLAGALNADPSKYESKGKQSVRSRITNIREFLTEEMDIAEFWKYLKIHLGAAECTALSAEELAEIRKLKSEKYDNWEWNFGHSPKFSYKNKKRWSGGILETALHIEAGRIVEIRYYGDFLSSAPLTELEAAHIGLPFTKESVAAVLDRFDLRLLFGSITKDEILSTLF